MNFKINNQCKDKCNVIISGDNNITVEITSKVTNKKKKKDLQT